MIADTSFVVALMNAGDDDHAAVSRWYAGHTGSLVTTPLALAEIDHLVTREAGQAAARVLREQIELGGLRIEWWPTAAYRAVEVAAEYDWLEIGLVDASLVALAERRATAEIATLDERHFRRIKPLTGEPAFSLLPADAD